MIQINKRRPIICVLLSFLTLGIYLIYWKYLILKNIKAIKKEDSGCTKEMLLWLLIPFYSIYWWYIRGKDVKNEFADQGYSSYSNGTTYMILSIFGLEIIAMVIMQRDFNSLPFKNRPTNKRRTINYLTRVAILSTVSAVLMIFEFPLPFLAPPFYEFDFSEIPVLIGTFALGPTAGVLIELIKVLLNFLINWTITGGVGELANFVMGCAFILPAGFIYKYHKSKSGALVSMLSGTTVLAISAFFINAYIMIPTYCSALGIPAQSIIDMGHAIMPVVDSVSEVALYCVVPFNLFKGVVISAITFVLYKHINRLLKKIK